MGRGKQKEWARRDKKSDPFARQKNRTTNEYRQFPRLKWVVHSVHEAEQKTKISQCGISNALDGTKDDLVWEEEEDSSQVEEEPDCDVYDDRITPEQWQELFGESDDEEEFHGF